MLADLLSQLAISAADFLGLFGGWRCLALQVLVQAEIGGDQGLAGVLDDVLSIVRLRMFPDEGLAVSVGDQVMNGNELVVLLGRQKRRLGLLDRSAGVE